ncbi:hypothetical protein M5E89_08635 [Acidaminococcus intestini]|nr:hypothetical protein M5E89_08635 [Acidaminococcus intestini]
MAGTVCEKEEGGDHDEEGYPHDLDVSHFVCQDTAQKVMTTPMEKSRERARLPLLADVPRTLIQ